MSNISIGSVVRLKGDHKIMTAIQIIPGNICEVMWTIKDNEINTFKFELASLEVVPTSEVEEERKRYNKRENAKVGLSIPDQISKIGSPIVAALSVIAIAIQTYRLSKLEDEFTELVKLLKTNVIEVPGRQAIPPKGD